MRIVPLSSLDQNDGRHGAALGSLKCECTDEVKKALKSKYSKGEIEIVLNEMRGGDAETKVPWRPIPYDDAILAPPLTRVKHG